MYTSGQEFGGAIFKFCLPHLSSLFPSSSVDSNALGFRRDHARSRLWDNMEPTGLCAPVDVDVSFLTR